MKDQQAEVMWRDGVPFSAQFDDPYFSLQDGLEETRHVFLQGNDLPDRFDQPLHIAELGFGTGLNFLAALDLWQRSGSGHPLVYSAFEAFPLTAQDMAQALAPFVALKVLAGRLCDAVAAGDRAFEILPAAQLTLHLGDARDLLPEWQGRADAWFLDGFAPSRNPELWSQDLMRQVGGHTAPGGTFATYTAAGHVRRALAAAGFAVERVPGYGRKRHMTRGRLS